LDKINKNFFESYDSFEISLGELLRGERATLGKSCSDVQKDLKIKAIYIKAIESCDIQGIENKSFIAGYVRTYARYLGLDPEYVYERFCSESGFLSSDLNSFVSTQKIKKETININQHDKKNLNFGKFSVNHFQVNFSSVYFLKKLLPICSLFLLLFGVIYWIMLIIVDIQRLEFIPIDQEPYSSVELKNINNEIFELNNNNFDVQTLNLDNIAKKSLGNLYSTRDETFPVVQNRDSPIAKIDPNSYGLFLETEKMQNPVEIKNNLFLTENNSIENEDVRTLVLRPKEPKLMLVAFEKSWIRLKDQNGDIYLERNLKKDEQFLIPSELFSGSLRAGNATKVFFVINGNLYGPLSSDLSVVKNFSINPEYIQNKLSFVSANKDFLTKNSKNTIKNLNTAKKID
jgi:cytoskeletal protein RodZ